MKALVKYYESGIASAEVPEIIDLREEIDESTDIVEYAKNMELPAAAEYAHIVIDGEPVIAITRDGIRDVKADEWIVEPDDEEE